MAAPAPAAWLEGSSPSEIGKRIDLSEGTVRLGRGSSSPVPLHDPMVSREHCEIRRESDGYVIVDLGSTHGTYVDGQRVQQARLNDGARLRLGACEFTFRLSQGAVPTVMEGGQPPLAHVARPAAVPRPVPLPPPAAAPVPASPPATPPVAPKPGRNRLVWGCGAVAIVAGCLCVLAVGVGLIAGGSAGIAATFNRILAGVGGDSASELTSEDLALALAAPSIDERPEVLERLGRPDEFDISIVQVEGGQVRLESWRYYGLGTRVDFADGVIVWTIDLDQVPGSTIFPAWYDPTAFDAGMTPESVTAVLTEASPAGSAPELIDVSEGGEDLAGLMLLVGDQITVGFENGGLVYAETVGMTVQEGGR